MLPGSYSPSIVEIKLSFKAYLVITSACRSKQVKIQSFEKFSPLFRVIESLDASGVTILDLDRLVNNLPSMSSLELAQRTNKNHYDVLKDIRNEVKKITDGYGLESLSPEDLGFLSSTYTTVQGKEMPCYLLTDKAVLQMAARYDATVRHQLIEENFRLKAQLASYLISSKLADEKNKGYLYIIRNTNSGRCKIGFSNNPEKRLKSLQTGSDALLEIAYKSPEICAPQEIEGVLHKEFADKRVIGEWFDLTVEDILPKLKAVPLTIPESSI